MTDTTEHLDLQNEDTVAEFFGGKELRWFQTAAKNRTAVLLEAKIKRILIKLPTGTGKTLTVAAAMGCPRIRAALGVPLDRNIRVLFAAHNNRLLTQAERTFIEDSSVDLIPQSIFSEIPDDVMKQGWDITVLDECHHESTSSFQYHLEKLGEKPLIGLTATDQRSDGALIKFEEIIEPLTREEAVQQGYLAETNIHSFVDVPSKSKTGMITSILQTYISEMGKTMMFVRTKKEVAEITKVISDMGYTAVGLLTQTSKELNVILDQFSEGHTQFLISVNRLGEGVDVKGCDTVFIGRTLGSYTLLNQVMGRANRGDMDESNVWELVNPLSSRNLDSTVISGIPKSHRLIAKEKGEWVERMFDYVSHRSNQQLGIVGSTRVHH